MTKKEAVRETLNFRKTIPVPYIFRFTIEAEDNYRRFKNGQFNPIEDTGSYAVFSQTNSGWKEIKPGYYKDYFGVVWNKTLDKTLGIVDVNPIQKPSFKNFIFPATESLPVYYYQKENNRRYPDHFHILSIGFALFERAWSLVGMEQLMMWMLTEPDFIHDLMDRIADFNISLINQASEIGGIDCVRFGDDWAGQHGLLIGEELWLEFIKPPLKRMCEAAKAKGLYIGQHCCGKVESLLPEMIDSGIDIFDPFQPEVMEVEKVFHHFYGKITFMGGLSIQKTMPYGSSEDVREESCFLLSRLGRKGGFIFSPSHAMTADIPPENIEMAIHIAQNQEPETVN